MPDQTIAELLAPETLARIDSYSLLARVAVEGFISGLHRSLYHGFGSEFFQYRSYVPGDDLKYVDWKVLGRRDRFYTKVYQEETNMNCCIMLDASKSMAYQGTRAPCTKLKYACMIAACLAYLASRQGDNVGFYAYSDTLVSSIPPGAHTGGLQRILTELHRIKPAGVADHDTVLTHLAQKLHRRGVIVLISDLLDTGQALHNVLKRFRFAHHECLVFQVLDSDEIDFPFARTTRFVDSETDAEMATAPELVRDTYVKAMTDYTEQIRRQCLGEQVDFLRIASADHLGNTLAAYLHRREALLR